MLRQENQDEEKDEVIEASYNVMLEALRDESHVLVKEITKDIIEKDYLSITKYFEHIYSGKEAISGFYYLNNELLEKLNNRKSNIQIINELRKTQEIINNSKNIRFINFPNLQELNERYGEKVTLWHTKLMWEYLENGNKKKYEKYSRIAKKMFWIYSAISSRFVKVNRDELDVEDIFREAQSLEREGKYPEAINKYKQVITIDSIYAAEVGCYNNIGDCYRYLDDFDNAYLSYKSSMTKDKKVPYQRNSYNSIRGMYLYDIPQIMFLAS